MLRLYLWIRILDDDLCLIFVCPAELKVSEEESRSRSKMGERRGR